MFFSKSTKVVKAKLSSEDLNYFLGGGVKDIPLKYDYDNINGTMTMDKSDNKIT